jgi:hypothetical protein
LQTSPLVRYDNEAAKEARHGAGNEREENAFCGSDDNGDLTSFRWLGSAEV